MRTICTALFMLQVFKIFEDLRPERLIGIANTMKLLTFSHWQCGNTTPVLSQTSVYVGDDVTVIYQMLPFVELGWSEKSTIHRCFTYKQLPGEFTRG